MQFPLFSSVQDAAVKATGFLPEETKYWYWLGFGVLVVVLLTLDLLVFHKEDHKPSLKESVFWTIVWIGAGLLFNVLIFWLGIQWGKGTVPGVQFLTGYLVEKSLSMDNIFVFVVIFRYFKIPMKFQYRVLFWGILGAIVMRGIFILGGVELFNRFEWLGPIFGFFLIYTAYKLVRHTGEDVHPEKNIVLRIARRRFRVSKGDHHQHGHKFFVRENGLSCVTPLFIVLLVIESTDVVFAVDSVPAIIGITNDPFLAFTSNIFAILGLRALYFLLAGVVEMFCFLHYGLAAILGFVGLKMVAEAAAKHWQWVGKGEHVIDPILSLLIICGLLAVSIAASILFGTKPEKKSDEFGDDPADDGQPDGGSEPSEADETADE